MTKSFCFSECLSHPGRKLADHLRSVETTIASELALLPAEAACSPSLAVLSRLAGACHDVAKATPFFQEYLARGGRRRSRHTRHAHLSALVAHHLGLRLLEARGEREDAVARTYLCFATLAVYHHHTDLADLAADWTDFVDASRTDDVLVDQWRSLDTDGLRAFAQKLLADLGAPVVWDPPEVETLRLAQGAGDVRGMMRHPAVSGTVGALALRHTYSLLIGCDKLDAALYGRLPDRPASLSATIVDEFRRRRFASIPGPLSPLRESVFRDTVEGIERHGTSASLFTLTAPTGSGKTLAMLRAGLALRDQAHKRGLAPPRVLYCLPFTSIIDQTYGVFEQVLTHDRGPLTPDVLLRHHHLADFRYETESAQYREDQAELLVESWQSEIVVTTFHQLLNGLFSHRNAEAKRFFRVPGSVLLLDEVQAIPRRHWDVVREALLALAHHYGTKVVLSTATRPLLLLPGDAIELCPSHRAMFEALDRVRLVSRIGEPTPLSEFAGRVGREILADRADIMVIVNTIASARYVHRRLSEVVPRENLFYLSTHLTPADRVDRLRVLQSRSRRRVLVSTQLVEAGVDLSFDRVYRDLAPLDCVIQAAGRCNRAAEGPRGRVELLWLQDDTRSRPWDSSRIYDPLLLKATRDVLPANGDAPEREFLSLTGAYFDRVRSLTGSAELELALARLEVGRVGSEFRLIDDALATQAYFVIRTDEDRSLWEDYRSLQELEDRAERRRRFQAIRHAFHMRLINVRRAKRSPDGPAILALEATGCPDGRYDPETGYEGTSEEGGTFVL